MKHLLDETTEAYFNSSLVRVSLELTLDEILGNVDQLMSQLNMFATGGSFWVVEKLSRLEIKTAQNATSPAGTYIEPPPILRNLKRSLLNIVNKKDSFCFCIALQLRYFLLLVLPLDRNGWLGYIHLQEGRSGRLAPITDAR